MSQNTRSQPLRIHRSTVEATNKPTERGSADTNRKGAVTAPTANKAIARRVTKNLKAPTVTNGKALTTTRTTTVFRKVDRLRAEGSNFYNADKIYITGDGLYSYIYHVDFPNSARLSTGSSSTAVSDREIERDLPKVRHLSA
jgi:hypothetical protein